MRFTWPRQDIKHFVFATVDVSGNAEPLERAAAMRGQSVAGFIEALVDRALADAGLIEQPNDVAAARR